MCLPEKNEWKLSKCTVSDIIIDIDFPIYFQSLISDKSSWQVNCSQPCKFGQFNSNININIIIIIIIIIRCNTKIIKHLITRKCKQTIIETVSLV